MRHSISILLTLLASIILVGVAPAAAQRTTATLAGLVVDTSGGALPGATIELVNDETAVPEQPQVSGATGEFVFNYVPVGKYTLTISLSGFKTYKSTGVQLSAAQNVRQRYQLEVGGIEENITVSGESPLVNALSPEQRGAAGAAGRAWVTEHADVHRETARYRDVLVYLARYAAR